MKTWSFHKAKGEFDSFFRLRIGQILIFVTAAALVLGMAAVSIYAASPHQVEKMSILQESNDAASIAYSQRESFNLLIAIRDFKDDEISQREMEIVRALLGQRLQVKLMSGALTYDIMTEEYRRGLAKLDKWIRDNQGKTYAQKHASFSNLKPTIDLFSGEVRRMSKSIQQDSLRQVTKVVQDRTRAEFWQSVALLVIILLGLILFLWIIRDLRHGFRRSKEKLVLEQTKLEHAQRQLKLSSKLDELQSQILGRSISDWKPGEFAATLQDLVWEIYPDAGIKYQGYDEVDGALLQIAHPAKLLTEDILLIKYRVTEIVEIHESSLNIHNEAKFRATHDLVTGLLNRHGFEVEFLHSALGANSLLLIDIDRFRRINDSFGREFGDGILQDVASTLRIKAPNALISRIGSDEFIVFYKSDDEDIARETALQIQSDLVKQIHHEGIDIDLTTTASLVFTSEPNVTFESLLHKAEIAKDLADRQIRNGFAIYTDSMNNEITVTLAEEHSLKQAIIRNELVLYLQPVVRLSDGKCVGAETLVRWNRPGYGIIHPDDFLPKIRDYDLTEEFTDWSLEAICRLRANSEVFREQFNIEDWHLGVNVEAEVLSNGDFADNFKKMLAKYQVSPADVVLEITERALAEGEIALANIRQLYDLGMWIAVDDFGTGYSNLNQIHNLPLTILKIDKTFMLELKESESASKVVRDIKRIADSLNLEVVAEGIEDWEIEATMREMGVQYGQGFYYSPALPEVEFWNWIRTFQNI